MLVLTKISIIYTLKIKFTCVRAHVYLLVRGGSEALGTKVAFVIFFACVDSTMNAQRVTSGEFLYAEFTFIRFLE